MYEFAIHVTGLSCQCTWRFSGQLCGVDSVLLLFWGLQGLNPLPPEPLQQSQSSNAYSVSSTLDLSVLLVAVAGSVVVVIVVAVLGTKSSSLRILG